MFLLPLQMLGCSHESSAADVVGRVRLGTALVGQHLTQLSADGVAAVLLSTCHRTELYWWGDADLGPWFETHVARRAESPLHLEHRQADLAVRHLFAVTAGMRSARFGEPEVMGQVRAAWHLAQAAHATHAQLDAVFSRALEAARHIRVAIGSDADPALGARVRSVIEGRIALAPAPRVLVVGAGDAARGVIEALTGDAPEGAAPWQLVVTSQSDARAQRLADGFAVRCEGWATFDDAVRAADVVIYAVQSSTPLVDGARADRLMADRTRPALWIDLGVPACVDARALPGVVEWIGLETIAPRSRDDALRDRRATAALQRELARFATAMQRRRIGACVPALEARAASVARAALASVAGAQGDPDSADIVARRVTRLLLRELTEISA